MKNLVEQLKTRWTDCKRVCNNVAEFLDACFLATVSGYAIYVFVHTADKTLWDWALGLSGVAIALQAFLLLVKHFNRG